MTGGSQTQRFWYDSLNRLEEACTWMSNACTTDSSNGRYHDAYSYDAVGNLTNKDGATYGYGAASGIGASAKLHAVTHLGGVQKYWYDHNGNMTDRIDASGHNWDFTWTVENHLSSATNTTTGTSLSFLYDGDGQMVQRTVNGQTTHYLGKLYHQTPTSGPSVKHYAFNGQLVVRLWDNVSLRYRLSDHLGSATTELNYAGAKTADVRYEPWGTERWVQTALSVPYFFTSQRWDSELGLYDYQARYYDAKIGRFISADAIVPDPANPQSLNRYAYGFNNPVKYYDPTGHANECGATGGDCGGETDYTWDLPSVQTVQEIAEIFDIPPELLGAILQIVQEMDYSTSGAD